MVKFTKSLTTHNLMLIKALLSTQGPVIEFGGGPFSTPLLHWLCRGQNRMLTTLESDPDYYWMCHKFKSKIHRIILVDDWANFKLRQHYSVAFLDHAPAWRRGIDAIRLANVADIVIIHDSCATDIFLDEVWPHYKYRYDFTPCHPFTAVLSNTIDVSKWDDKISRTC